MEEIILLVAYAYEISHTDNEIIEKEIIHVTAYINDQTNPYFKTYKSEVLNYGRSSHVPPNRRLRSAPFPPSHPRDKPYKEIVRTANFSFIFLVYQ